MQTIFAAASNLGNTTFNAEGMKRLASRIARRWNDAMYDQDSADACELLVKLQDALNQQFNLKLKLEWNWSGRSLSIRRERDGVPVVLARALRLLRPAKLRQLIVDADESCMDFVASFHLMAEHEINHAQKHHPGPKGDVERRLRKI